MNFVCRFESYDRNADFGEIVAPSKWEMNIPETVFRDINTETKVNIPFIFVSSILKCKYSIL